MGRDREVEVPRVWGWFVVVMAMAMAQGCAKGKAEPTSAPIGDAGPSDAAPSPDEALPPGDGTGPDWDGDGVPNATDLCPLVPNPEQSDIDGDGRGNACDNCVAVANANQIDYDDNGVGDACEEVPEGTPLCASGSTEATLVPPNLYVLLDRSGSMNSACSGCGGVKRWEGLAAALDAMSGTLVERYNVGVAAFPVGDQCGVDMPGFELLDLAPGWTAAQFRASYAGVVPGGYTPAQQALDTVRTQTLSAFSQDPLAARSQAVVLITDGQPNCDGDVASTALAAGQLHAAGVPVYVIGFANLNPVDMDRIAEAGRGLPATAANDWYPVTDQASIEAALEAITRSLVACTLPVELDGDEDMSRMFAEVTIDGTSVRIPEGAPDGWTFDATDQTVTLHGASCSSLQAASEQGQQVSVTVGIGCDACPWEVEVCDLVDNDCDGVVDEDCPPDIE